MIPPAHAMLITMQARADRARVVISVWLLLVMHAALVEKAYVGVSVLWPLAAYNGGLGAFAAALGMTAAWHASGPRPGARMHHLLIVAWPLGVLGALLGWAMAPVAAWLPASVQLGVAALVGPMVATVIAARATHPALESLARSSSSLTLSAAGLQVRLCAYAATAGAVFGLFHPPVRFPLELPDDEHALPYALAGMIASGTLIPLAAYKLTRGLTSSGLAKTPHQAPMVGLALTMAVACALGAWVSFWQPTSMAEWMTYRAVAGAALGATAAIAGAALVAEG